MAQHSAKQEITETIKFLTWLHETHHRTAATCRQQDIDEWLATGPTTRTKIRTFVVWTNKSKINTALHLDAPQARSTACSPKTSGWHGLKDSSPATWNHCPTVSLAHCCCSTPNP